jgi:hypothetical protein
MPSPAPGDMIERSSASDGAVSLELEDALLVEIRALLALPSAEDREPYLARVEHTLTSGYARALALEGERLRLGRRIGELAALGDRTGVDELASLARRAADAESSLAALRSELATLRDHAASVRAA